jgi:hypothetical protein
MIDPAGPADDLATEVRVELFCTAAVIATR